VKRPVLSLPVFMGHARRRKRRGASAELPSTPQHDDTPAPDPAFLDKLTGGPTS
jgi:hypothetical protein